MADQLINLNEVSTEINWKDLTKALVSDSAQDNESVYNRLAANYQSCMDDMAGRGPGNMCMSSARLLLRPGEPNGYQIPFNYRAGGCGAAMRAACIGLRYPRASELQELIALSVESGRMTHHNPTGYLGAVAAALFTSYALQGKSLNQWGRGLMQTLPDVWKYVESQGRHVQESSDTWFYFTNKWASYLKTRGIADNDDEAIPEFPISYGVQERDDFYKSLSYSGWGGASGHDAPMIAYDALLGSGNSWPELCNRAAFHAGDSDSTATIAAAWYGALYGFDGVPDKNHKNVEYRSRMKAAAQRLYELSHCDDNK